MSKIEVTTVKNKIHVNETKVNINGSSTNSKVVSVVTQGSQGAAGLELIDTNRVDGSIVRYKASVNSYVADADVTPLKLTDGGNFWNPLLPLAFT